MCSGIIHSDHEPRTIQNCPYSKGDILTITYKQGTVPIQKYTLKKELEHNPSSNDKFTSEFEINYTNGE